MLPSPQDLGDGDNCVLEQRHATAPPNAELWRLERPLAKNCSDGGLAGQPLRGVALRGNA